MTKEKLFVEVCIYGKDLVPIYVKVYTNEILNDEEIEEEIEKLGYKNYKISNADWLSFHHLALELLLK